ncbi:MAG: glutamine-hydrolyzing GMP synthase [Candidatus Faecousia sp.]|nr:glutamine-hydrolyzing GMP synthase [Clostridiales bacterium]MDD6297558.1 glutamine-hydrolyzing GMP synthase [Bacillota bacterium]MDD7341679.1 glutamine-hydrolyzing GMP synthase [Bacillota bacterium]MDY2810103.1 glutamine-hydrolyzing GMP synthase [Candidatus Faecousia sp.]
MQKVLILDFGGQYNQLIARRVRECHVYCEVHPASKATVENVRAFGPIGIILTGGPNSVYAKSSPSLPKEIFEMGIPVLGICYGCQLMAHTLGGVVTEAGENDAREYGRTVTHLDPNCILFEGFPEESITWMSHGDYISKVPEGFTVTGFTDACPTAAMAAPARKLYGVQFHPEVSHTDGGIRMIDAFVKQVCGGTGDWLMEDYVTSATKEIREKVGDQKVLLALSGGVDSSVAAALLSRAIGNQLTCIFVDHGLLRKDEGDQVEAVFSRMDLNFIRVNAQERFLSKLAGVEEPERKRKIIGEEFIRVFEAEAKKIGKVDFLAQGTIYPDVIESGLGSAAVIKSHHNVGGLPDYVDFREIIEPLRLLFKDEVRELGRAMGLPSALVNRQPFPGPGLAIRIIGEVTQEKLDILRDADAIFRNALEEAHQNESIGQYFAVLTNTRSVGVMGDGRTYDYTLALRAVTTDDFMTAKWARIPYELLDKISGEIVNHVPCINRIVYDITSKPPATIEWE